MKQYYVGDFLVTNNYDFNSLKVGQSYIVVRHIREFTDNKIEAFICELKIIGNINYKIGDMKAGEYTSIKNTGRIGILTVYKDGTKHLKWD